MLKRIWSPLMRMIPGHARTKLTLWKSAPCLVISESQIDLVEKNEHSRHILPDPKTSQTLVPIFGSRCRRSPRVPALDWEPRNGWGNVLRVPGSASVLPLNRDALMLRSGYTVCATSCSRIDRYSSVPFWVPLICVVPFAKACFQVIFPCIKSAKV